MLRARTIASFVVASFVLSAPLRAQSAVDLQVSDQTGRGVPFAVVWTERTRPIITDSAGRLRLTLRGDSALLQVRRIGFREFRGYVRLVDGRAQVEMRALALQMDTVRVVERVTSPLENRGFYDRVERVKRGAIVGEFYPPEEIALRNSSRVSDLLRGSRYARVGTTQSGNRVNVPVVLGRGGCAMTIIVDGVQLKATVQDIVKEETPTSIRNPTSPTAVRDNLPTIDDVVDGRSVVAIEVYPSTANAPAELQTLGGRGSCGIIAIWTGSPQ